MLLHKEVLRLLAARRAQSASDTEGKHTQQISEHNVHCKAAPSLPRSCTCCALRSLLWTKCDSCWRWQWLSQKEKKKKTRRKRLRVFYNLWYYSWQRSVTLTGLELGLKARILKGKLLLLGPAAISVLLGASCTVGCGCMWWFIWLEHLCQPELLHLLCLRFVWPFYSDEYSQISRIFLQCLSWGNWKYVWKWRVQCPTTCKVKPYVLLKKSGKGN